MSHNVTVSDIKINDIDALRMAVEELSQEGKKIKLLTNATYRGYSAVQSGVYPYVLNLIDSPYDVALQSDGQGNYSPVFDPWQSHVKKQIGINGGENVEGKACDINSNPAHLGLLMQRYAVCKAELEAGRAGLSTTRMYDDKTKQYNLEVVGY